MKIFKFLLLVPLSFFLFACVVTENTAEAQKKEVLFPKQSEKGKCELRLNKKNQLYCEQKPGCKGKCILYSLPQGKPKAEWTIEEQPVKPEKGKYYFCRCLEL